MRLSTLVGRTLRQPPADAHLPSHQLLVRAGCVRALEGGLFAYLPLGLLTLRRLEGLARRELTPLAAQEVALPPASDADPAAGFLSLVRREVDSHRQLPACLFQTAIRSTPTSRSRAGLFGASQRPVFELYAFGSANGMATVAEQATAALERILVACGLPALWAGGRDGERRLYLAHPSGDESLVRCPGCGYAAERGWATTAWQEPPGEPELPVEEVATPGCNTIAALAGFLDVPATRTLKMVFYSAAGRVTCAVIRGDRAVDEAKLTRLLSTDRYYASLEEELAEIGAVGGYASPIGLRAGQVRVVADLSVRAGANWITGANRPGYHLRNVNIPRDFDPGEWADLALVEPGDLCPQCGNAVAVEEAFRLVDGRAAGAVDAEYLDDAGRPQPLWMAGWRLDLGRLLAAVVEQHYDGYGIIWPAACAPLKVHLVALDLRQDEVAAQAEALYERLSAGGLAVLYDDRDLSAGVKFADADLIGLPLRLTVSKRSAPEGLVEAKWRDSADRLRLDDGGLAVELAKLGAK
ncbi:MAG: proline--tRNA ligase [Anaerolineae bacterium]|nr:proline--tRNA ligase [Anaerolineae bacterium]